ncbi:uncharacterized protein LOC144623052 [Crassostrea virginica]
MAKMPAAIQGHQHTIKTQKFSHWRTSPPASTPGTMAVSTRFYSMCVLLVAVLFISFQGAFGIFEFQCSALSTCRDSMNSQLPADFEDKESLCKAVDTYFRCTENAIEQCKLHRYLKDVMAKSKELVVNYECSAPGLPAVSALCLLMAALFHMLL